MVAERIAILGCSRGLGREVALACGCSNLLLVARKQPLLAQLQSQLESGKSQIRTLSTDFANESAVNDLIGEIQSFRPTRIWYFAGGGPHGPCGVKKWKDHQWALQVSLLTPIQLVHHVLHNPELGIKQFIVVGSAIAENQADPYASSYAAAKHGLRGFIASVQKEQETKHLDLRIFSPGYLDTELLPKNAKPRLEGAEIRAPKEVASEFCAWAKS